MMEKINYDVVSYHGYTSKKQVEIFNDNGIKTKTTSYDVAYSNGDKLKKIIQIYNDNEFIIKETFFDYVSIIGYKYEKKIIIYNDNGTIKKITDYNVVDNYTDKYKKSIQSLNLEELSIFASSVDKVYVSNGYKYDKLIQIYNDNGTIKDEFVKKKTSFNSVFKDGSKADKIIIIYDDYGILQEATFYNFYIKKHKKTYDVVNKIDGKFYHNKKLIEWQEPAGF